jgi:hypothetical protein
VVRRRFDSFRFRIDNVDSIPERQYSRADGWWRLSCLDQSKPNLWKVSAATFASATAFLYAASAMVLLWRLAQT